MKTEIPAIVTVDDYAELLDVTPRHVRTLVSDGICISAGRGKIALKGSIRGLLEHTKRSQDRDAEAASRAVLNDLRAKREAAKLAILSGEFIPREEAEAILDEMMAVIRFALDAMPSRIAGHDWNLRRKIETARDEALIAASEKLEKMSEERKSK
ncbi:MAG: hypothetical protein INF18_04985 [Methylobacterium sp.]|nr:hypothetical protein [Methylobacterium sp.]MCA3637807.1 hypothetical protein [Methylobacterium sp.]